MLITVAKYSFPYEAHIAKAKLDAAGIPAFVADEHTINMNWLYSNALGGVRLQVPEACVERANELLVEVENSDLLEPSYPIEGVCASCGSGETEYHQIGKRWAFLAWLGIGFPLFPVKDGILCRKCGAISES